MKFFNTYKKEVSTLLMLAFFHGFVFEAMATITRQTPLHPSLNVPYYVDTTVETQENDLNQIESSVHLIDEEQEALWRAEATGTTRKASQQKAEKAQAEKGSSTTLYPSDMTHGEIGRSERNVFDAPDDNLFKVEIKDAIDVHASYTLTYEVYGIGNAAGVTKSINTNTSTGGFFIEKNKEWTRVTEFVSPYSLGKGVNTVLFTSDLKADLGYLIRNLQIEKEEGVQTDLVYINDAVKKTDANEVYVQGVLNTNDPELQLFIDGREIAISNSGFEKMVAVDLETAKELFLEVKKGDITLEKKSVAVSNMTEVNHNKALDKAFEITNYEVNVREEQYYQLENIAITLPAESYAENFKLSIQELRESDYAPTGMALKNVTKNKAAYRFLPDGITFAKDATIKIKYDLTKLPAGYSAKDIQVFYFDTNLKQWTKVKVLDILEESGEVVASTNHFTDYIAGVIQEPESPEGNAFAPTTISGIQAANPTENISMVSVPQINDRGDASLSFPLQLPAARQGMVPSLSVNYNSSSDEGDFGLGWSLSVQSIEVDTRWGVPAFDATKETESYLFNGEELLLVKPDKTLYAPHKDPLINRVSGAKFQKMQHDPSLEITRSGLSGGWVVKDSKTGWTNYFEGGSNGKWYLSEVRDSFGNKIEYTYSGSSGKKPGLSQIKYNLYEDDNSQESIFIVDIIRKTNIDSPSKQRMDVKINNRIGSSEKSVDLIDKIRVESRINDSDVFFSKNFAVEYEFKYKEGKFGRSLLNKIIQLSYSNSEFQGFIYPVPSNIVPDKQEYIFDYHDDVGTGGLFETTGKTINTYKDYETSHENLGVHISALGGGEGKSTSFSGGGSFGVVIPIFPNSYLPFSRSATLGGNIGGGNSNSETKVLMADIDGDGLPDKIFKGGDDFYYRKNLGGLFSSEVYTIKKLPGLSYSKSKSSDESVTLNILAGSATQSFTESVSTTSTYTADVNADGLLDVVVNERVHFGYIDPQTKLPTFSLDSSITPAIVMKEDDAAPVLNPMPQLDMADGLMDVVMVWRAPSHGQVRISGVVNKQHIALQSGVKFSIEKLEYADMGEATFIYGPHLMLSSSDSHDQIVNVRKGDALFFRVHSNQMPVQELGVTWNPKIEYLTNNFPSALGYPQYSSSYQDSFIIGSNYEHTFKQNGKYRLEWPTFNFTTGERINIKISYYKKGTDPKNNIPIIGSDVVIYEKLSLINGTTTFSSPNIVLDMKNITNDGKTFHYVKVEVLSESEVNWKDIDTNFKPKLTSLGIQDDVILIPYYSNYGYNYSVGPPSNFTGYAANRKILIKHDFYFRFCTTEQCDDRYIYLVVKYEDGSVATFNNANNYPITYAKFRYKIAGNGAIKKREVMDYPNQQYKDVGATSEHLLINFVGKKVFFEYYTLDDHIGERIGGYLHSLEPTLIQLVGEPVKDFYQVGGNQYGLYIPNSFVAHPNKTWGVMYRNWGQFAYKGAAPGGTYEPIKGEYVDMANFNFHTVSGKSREDILGDPNMSLDDVENNFEDIKSVGGNVSNYFSILMPNKELYRWESHEHLYVSKTAISPYLRFLTDEIPDLKPPTVPVLNFGAIGITKHSKVKNKSFNKSIGFLVVNVGDTKTEGNSDLLNEFVDINGDGFPDIIGSKTQLTGRRGGLSNRILNVNFNTSTQINGSGSLVGGGSTIIKSSASDSGGKLNLVVGNQASGSLSGSAFNTTNETSRFYVDINGDGLIDIVEPNGSILMNYGGTFTTYSGGAWGALQKQASTTQTKGGGAGVGFSAISNMDISLGASASHSVSKDKVTYMDLNGDGLPEKIVDGSTYFINLGTRFDTTANALPGTQTQKSTEAGVNGNGTVCIYFTVPIIFTGPKICVSVGGSSGRSYSSEESRYMDFDADGNIDYVTSEKNESVTVFPSRVRRTNLLKKVTQSTGATIELDYSVTNPIDKKPIGATYKMPYKKWALTKVTVYDGFIGDGENYTRYAYEYFNGYKDRKERSFLGFGETRSHLLDKNGVPYRTNVTEYLNNDMTDAQLYRPGISSDLKQFLYKKGLTKRTYTLDRTKRMLNESLYTYKFYDSAKVLGDLNTTTNLSSEVSVYTDKLSVLPLVTSIINRVTSFDEDVQNSSLTKETTQKFNLYDKFGNVKKYLDVKRGVTVDMEYNYGIKTLPTSHRVSTTSGNQMLRMTKAISDDGILIHEIKKYITPTKFATYNFEYNELGNLTKKIFPAQNGTRYFYEYEYGQFYTYNTGDDFNDFNHRRIAPSTIRDPFGNEMKMMYNASGLPIRVMDFYGEEVTYKYDRINRLLEVKGPYDLEWTIRNEFVSNRVAISKHNLGQGNVLHTSMINDGLGRTLQVKKETLPSEDSPMCGGQLPEVRLAVSGDIVYDEFGRSIENYLSEEELACPNTTPLDVLLRNYYQGPRTPEKRINRIYDQNDRVVEELVFGTNAKTKTKYAFGKDRNGLQQFTQEITLPEGNKTISYTNELGLTTSQKQVSSSGDLWTSYVYDQIGQTKEVKNALEQSTTYIYDNLGRVSQKFLPASGITNFTYDDLGNITNKTDSNGTSINYKYEFNRLKEINEPTIQTKFFYDVRGHLDRMEDLSGSQEFTYGKLGEVIEEFKTVNDANGVPKYFRTKYKYDSWGRILEMVYPDNEHLYYIYNRVGQLTTIQSNHFNFYLEDVKYTHFDQPYYMKYGNGVEMHQEFDLTERLRAAQLSSPDLGVPNLMHVFSRSVYGFDRNNNITSQSNDFSQHQNIVVGGTSQRVHQYDDFNRLQYSQGTWDGRYESHDYSLEMHYNKDHSIQGKIQTHYFVDKFSGQGQHSDNSLIRKYQYRDDSRLEGIGGHDHLGNEFNDNYEYYNNGNLAKIDRQVMLPTNGYMFHNREFLWDANNNITQILDSDGQTINEYVYDGKGERVAKRLLVTGSLVVNGGSPQVGMYGTDEMLYPSGNISFSEYVYTNHIYANGKRVASRIGDTPTDPTDAFHSPSFQTEDTSPHEGLIQNRGRQRQAMSSSNTAGGIVPFAVSPEALCETQVNLLLNVLYNSPEKIDCKNDILAILTKHRTFGSRCAEYSTGNPKTCLVWELYVTGTNYCAALEEINTLVCIERTSDGMIIDHETGYIYDPLTGLPYDPITREPIDMGLGSGGVKNQLQLDCYNKYLKFIEYYKDKPNKPVMYLDLLKYLDCLIRTNEPCYYYNGVTLKTDEHGVSYYEIDWCSITADMPELPVEPEEPIVIPVFPDIVLTPGVNDTWVDNPPADTDIVNIHPKQQIPVWWYHSDHLGSSSYITDILGKPVQYYEYLPFGEIMVQQSTNNIFENVYKFNGKELDEQTGYYYYGARYYDPGASIFLSVDPLAEKMPNYNPYVYTFNNPINLTDPTGMVPEKGDGHYYGSDGTTYLGTDGKSDNKAYTLNSGTKANFNNKSVNWGGTLDEKHSAALRAKSTEGVFDTSKVDTTVSSIQRTGSGFDFSSMDADFMSALKYDVPQGLQNVGDGVALFGYGATLSGVGAGPGILLAGIGNGMSFVGSGMEAISNAIDGNYGKSGQGAGFMVAGELLNTGLNKVIPGPKIDLGKEIIKQGAELKLKLIENQVKEN
ncbi:RHS repeat-associated core domain-containing protein [Myroides guanonis]|uniref:RHS repeat-associated core domain-containing protein n=1 Tax=Myroides guanonis TaxID=1150112 RepID=A0A1I3PFX1_9FLAO|nr:RHS repeat-associated core domain-containing protein [Myroides guanonis]SFJ20247.1 RHS repeat-associated core domain-containing protein [Myroides guanonis]